MLGIKKAMIEETWRPILNIATDKRGYPHNNLLFLHENICCGYSLEAPRRGASNDLGEALLMSTHNICFHGEIRKYQHFSDEKSALSVAMIKDLKSTVYKTLICLEYPTSVWLPHTATDKRLDGPFKIITTHPVSPQCYRWVWSLVWRRCRVSYVTEASDWNWLTVGQGLLSFIAGKGRGESFYYTPDIRSIWGHIVFAFPFVRSFIRTYVRSFVFPSQGQSFCVKVYKTSYFEDPLMDFVHLAWW